MMSDSYPPQSDDPAAQTESSPRAPDAESLETSSGDEPLDLFDDMPLSRLRQMTGDEAASPLSAVPPAPPPPPKPAVWPTLLIAVLIVPVAVLVAGTVIGVVASIEGGADALENQEALEAWIFEFASTPRGFVTLLLPGQLTFLLAALIAARKSDEPLRQRLGLTRPAVPVGIWLLFMAATPTISMISYMLFPFLHDDPGEHLRQMEQIVTQPAGAHAVLVIALITIAPGISEELFFRGFVQTRLLRRWGAVGAILFASVLFAVAHVDWKHGLAVLPIGVWLGVIAWRCASVWPAVLCHMYNNLYACVMARMGLTETADVGGFGVVAALTIVLPITAFFIAAGVMTPPRWWRGGDDERATHGAAMWLGAGMVGLAVALAAALAMAP